MIRVRRNLLELSLVEIDSEDFETCTYCMIQGALYGMAQSIPDRTMVGEICAQFLTSYYSTDKPSVANGN